MHERVRSRRGGVERSLDAAGAFAGGVSATVEAARSGAARADGIRGVAAARTMSRTLEPSNPRACTPRRPSVNIFSRWGDLATNRNMYARIRTVKKPGRVNPPLTRRAARGQIFKTDRKRTLPEIMRS